jgi:hypothetical protein
MRTKYTNNFFVLLFDDTHCLLDLFWKENALRNKIYLLHSITFLLKFFFKEINVLLVIIFSSYHNILKEAGRPSKREWGDQKSDSFLFCIYHFTLKFLTALTTFRQR